MARIHGRTVRASNLAERRILSSLGVHALRVPRGQNPFLVARKLRQASRPNEAASFLAAVAMRQKAPKAPNGQSGAAAEAA